MSMRGKPKAVDQYVARIGSIIAKLDELRDGAAEHYGVDPEACHWANVGDVAHLDCELGKLVEWMKGEEK